ncbi:MAG: L-serine ammonia-lyase, iron-sulfur-dependent, subunit alpha [Spirochaetota bacterium]
MLEATAKAYIAILKDELVPAMGCTEPIAVAYAAAKAREVLGSMPEGALVRCSANIVKNVKGVTVPNTGGMKGIDTAAIAGIVSGKASAKLEVLASLTGEDIAEVRRLRSAGFCAQELAQGIEGLFIDVQVRAGGRSARVVVEHSHTGISRIEKDGIAVFEEKGGNPGGVGAAREAYGLLNVKDILEFAETVDLDGIGSLIRQQIAMNSAIAEEGLSGNYGVSVGKNLLKYGGSDVRVRARAKAAAGSDARMGGCALPVMINSGSGNQGITVTLPVVEYAEELGSDEDRLIRAVIISNLVSLEQKEYIGKLSAYCGAVSAAVGSAAAIAWLKGGSYGQVSATIINAIATADGILCDGAKASCAAKIATALEAAMMAHEIGMEEGKSFGEGEGLVGADVEQTIRNVGIVGSVGMKPTDVEIIKLMLK